MPEGFLGSTNGISKELKMLHIWQVDGQIIEIEPTKLFLYKMTQNHIQIHNIYSVWYKYDIS